MSTASDKIILYDGAKLLWESKTNVDIIINHHVSLSCLEIISYNPNTALEGPRIYVSYTMLIRKIQKETTVELHDEIELHMRNHTGYDEKWLQHAIINNLIVQYILTRVALAPGLNEGEFGVILKLLPNDTPRSATDSTIDVQWDKPSDLIPYVLVRKLHTS